MRRKFSRQLRHTLNLFGHEKFSMTWISLEMKKFTGEMRSGDGMKKMLRFRYKVKRKSTELRLAKLIRDGIRETSQVESSK